MTRSPVEFALWVVLIVPAIASAQRPVVGTTASGLRGLVHTGLPTTEPELNLAAGAGYGLTEPFAPVAGSHHRAQGSLGAALAPVPWLAFALRLDGRLELHPDDGRGAHSAGFGDPRLFARAGHELSPSFSIGAELGLWFPGTEAPSFEPGATSGEARALFAWAPRESDWAVLGAFGYRLDNSADSAPADLSRVRLGDRISLGLSDAHAVLGALGLLRRLGEGGELFTELSADLLVGEQAPALLQSPLRAALGGRVFLSRAVQVELTAIASLSRRPEVTATDPLVPIEPRVAVLAALRYGIAFGPSDDALLDDSPPAPDVAPEPPPTPPPPPPPPPAFASVAGALVDDQGQPLPEAKVTLRGADGESREAITDAEGRYAFADVPVGPAALEAQATGFETQTWQLEVTPDLAPAAPRPLLPKTDAGVLRGLIRSFDSTPLRAEVRVTNRRGKSVARAESGEDGRFEIELPPGRYQVTIRAPGFRTHHGKVKVEGNGVAILNVDMRERR